MLRNARISATGNLETYEDLGAVAWNIMRVVIAGRSNLSPRVIRRSSATATARVVGDGRGSPSQPAFSGLKIGLSFSADWRSYAAFPSRVMRKAANSVARYVAGQCVHSCQMGASMTYSEVY